MNTANELGSLTSELAGHWTGPVLEMVKALGVPHISVDMEVEAWRNVRKVLRIELRWRRAARLATLGSLRTLMENVLRRSAEQVLLRVRPGSLTPANKTQIRRWASDLRASANELELYALIVHQPELHAAFKPPSRTDFTPRLRLVGAGV